MIRILYFFLIQILESFLEYSSLFSAYKVISELQKFSLHFPSILRFSVMAATTQKGRKYEETFFSHL